MRARAEARRPWQATRAAYAAIEKYLASGLTRYSQFTAMSQNGYRRDDDDDDDDDNDDDAGLRY